MFLHGSEKDLTLTKLILYQFTRSCLQCISEIFKFFLKIIWSKITSLNSFLIGQLYWSHNCTAWSVINMSITIAQELYKIHNTLSTMYRIANDKHTPKRKKIFNLNFDTVHVFLNTLVMKKQKQHLKILSNWLINFWFNICSWIFFHHGSLTKCM